MYCKSGLPLAGGVPDKQLVVVSNRGIIYLELGTSMGKKGNMRAISAML
jgi:hypothetical protein